MQGQGSVGGIGMGMALDNSAGQGQGQHFMQQQSMSVGSRASYGNGQQGTLSVSATHFSFKCRLIFQKEIMSNEY